MFNLRSGVLHEEFNSELTIFRREMVIGQLCFNVTNKCKKTDDTISSFFNLYKVIILFGIQRLFYIRGKYLMWWVN